MTHAAVSSLSEVPTRSGSWFGFIMFLLLCGLVFVILATVQYVDETREQ